MADPKVLVVSDDRIFGGKPVFAGTRLPIATVLGALDAGDTLESIQRVYPYLTEEHVAAAREYEKKHGSSRQSPRLEDLHPDLVKKASGVLGRLS